MKIYDLSCPKCSAPLSVSSELGLVQCKYCGSTLYIDAHDHIKLNSKKITENLNELFSRMKKDAVANHRAIAHGSFGHSTNSVHFKDKPVHYENTTNKYDSP